MRMPSGIECKHYYADFHRGYHTQECRLIKQNLESLPWHPSDCAKCPIPAMLNANASPDLELKLTIKTKLLGLQRKSFVTAACAKHRTPIDDVFVGCLQCNAERPGLDLFRQALEQDEPIDED